MTMMVGVLYVERSFLICVSMIKVYQKETRGLQIDFPHLR